MALSFITGKSGSGKTTYMMKMIVEESIKNPDIDYLIIVPEQFTLQTQKEIVATHPDGGIMNIDVLSFNRLAYRVFDEIGKKTGLVLADTGKNMVLRRIIEAHADSLLAYGRNYNKQGFISEIKSFISELYQYSVSPDDIKKFVDDNPDNGLLSAKLNEIYTIYEAFRQFLKERYITAEELLDILAGVIDKSQIIKNSVICLDGYTGFTPSQMGILYKMILLAKEMYVTLTIMPGIKECRQTSLFYVSYKTKQRLMELAKKAGVNVLEDIDVSEHCGNGNKSGSVRFKDSEELSWLEKNIFRVNGDRYQNENENIKICALSGCRDELEMVADEIAYLAGQGYRYSEMAVVCGDIEKYGTLATGIFKRKGIPCFVDYKKKVMDNPFIDMIGAVFEIVKTDYSFDSVFRYVRSGMSGVSSDEADILENYALAAGIKHESIWKKEWKAQFRKDYKDRMEQINSSRQKVCDELDNIIRIFPKKGLITEYANATMDMIKRLDCEKKLAVMADEFAADGNYVLEKEYDKVYEMVMELFDQMIQLLGDTEVSFDEYIKIFEAGIAEIKIGVIPMTTDQVVVGDIERTRFNDIKVLFMIGANDGIIPKNTGAGSVISDLEREKLSQMGLELAPTRRQASFIGQFYLYINLTKPSEKLFISYSTMSDDAKPINESYVITRIMGIFPKLEINTHKNVFRNSGREYMLSGISAREHTPLGSEWNEVLRWNMTHDDGKQCVDMMMDAAFNENADKDIDKELADKLYGGKTYSVSRIEKFATCAYAHFLRYGLGLSERDEYELKTPDMGSIFHAVMENYSVTLKERGIKWSDISQDMLDDIMDSCVKSAVASYENGILLSSKRNEFKIKQIGRIAKKTGWALSKHVAEGKFEPAGFEVRFSHAIDDDSNSTLIGVVDRIDTCFIDEKNEKLVKIIDYKSGDKGIDTALLKKGISMQLLVYMDAAVKSVNEGSSKGVKAVPAGAFYYRFNDPVLDMRDDFVSYGENGDIIYNQEAIDGAICNELKMTGLINSDPAIIEEFEKDVEYDKNGNMKAKTMNVKADAKSGKEYCQPGLLSTEQFMDILDYTRENVEKIDENIRNGVIERNPFRYNKKTGCDYCEFKGICRFDPMNGMDKYVDIKSERLSDLLAQIKCKKEGGSGNGLDE